MMLRREFPFFESGKLIRAMKMAPKPVQYKCARALLLMSFLTLVQMAFAQPGIELDGTVTEKETNRKLAGVDVKVFRSGAIYDAVSTLSNGKYAVSLEHGTDYMLLFTFEDLSERRVELKTSSIPEEYRDQPFYLKVEMSLFEVPDGFDEALLQDPIGKVSFDPRSERLAWDLDYTSMMQSRINDALAAAESSGGTADNAEYDEHMRKAEVEFGRERWEQSINWLERALNEKPGDVRAEGMLEDAQERLVQAEEEEAARREYEVSMREGKLAMRKEAWSAAISAFEAAHDLLPSEEEPVALLAEVRAAQAASEGDDDTAEYEAALAAGQAALDEGDLVAAEASYERAAALRTSERLPKEKLAEIRQRRKSEEREADAAERRRAEYDDLIARADTDFDNQDYVQAKARYEQAAAMMPSEEYPKARALEADGRIVILGGGEEAEPEAPRSSEAGKVDREYEDRIREGDLAFDSEDWEEAISAYNAALELKPTERYPRNRLKRIEALSSDEEALSGQLDVDLEAQREESSAAAEASAAETDAIAAEQARILEEEREAAKREKERKANASAEQRDAELERSQNYVLAMQRAGDDDAEAYYRDALEAEIRARAQAVYTRAERQADLQEVWVSNGDNRRQSAYRKLTLVSEQQEANAVESASYRIDRSADLDVRTEAHSALNQDWEARGNAGRRDRVISLRRKTEANDQALFDRTKRYAVFADSLDRMLQTYEDFNRDLRRASVDTRMMRFNEIERSVQRNARIGENAPSKRQERWSDVQKQEQDDQQSKRVASGEATLRSEAAWRKAEAKDSGEAPTSADYREVPAMEGIRQGVEERSYEEGNALIIERTVRVDNEVNVYRKTVAKHGVYYFKNNRSITREIWVLETFEISD